LHSSFLLTFNTTLFSLFFWYRRWRRVTLKFARNNLNFLISTKKKREERELVISHASSIKLFPAKTDGATTPNKQEAGKNWLPSEL
jgi:hypothetical protein